jgi:hypothetical protein
MNRTGVQLSSGYVLCINVKRNFSSVVFRVLVLSCSDDTNTLFDGISSKNVEAIIAPKANRNDQLTFDR